MHRYRRSLPLVVRKSNKRILKAPPKHATAYVPVELRSDEIGQPAALARLHGRQERRQVVPHHPVQRLRLRIAPLVHVQPAATPDR